MPMTHVPRTALIMLTALISASSFALGHEYEGKAVTVAHPWARATPGGSTIGAAYVELSGLKASAGDKLVGASSPVAGRIEIHTHTMTDGVMAMRKVDQVGVAAGEVHKLAPGGDHLMLFDLKAPLKEGEVFPLTLKFETSGDIIVDAVIESVGAMAPHGMAATGPDDAKNGMEGSDAGSHDGH